MIGGALDEKAALASFSARFPRTGCRLLESLEPRALVLTFEGSLDGSNSQAFHDLLLTLFPDAKGKGGLIIDLAGLDYISSTGVGALTTILAEAQGHRLALMLCGLPEHAKSIFDLLGFTLFFDMIPSYKATG
jgi:anti-sigma B factor antagonist